MLKSKAQKEMEEKLDRLIIELRTDKARATGISLDTNFIKQSVLENRKILSEIKELLTLKELGRREPDYPFPSFTEKEKQTYEIVAVGRKTGDRYFCDTNESASNLVETLVRQDNVFYVNVFIYYPKTEYIKGCTFHKDQSNQVIKKEMFDKGFELTLAYQQVKQKEKDTMTTLDFRIKVTPLGYPHIENNIEYKEFFEASIAINNYLQTERDTNVFIRINNIMGVVMFNNYNLTRLEIEEELIKECERLVKLTSERNV